MHKLATAAIACGLLVSPVFAQMKTQTPKPQVIEKTIPGPVIQPSPAPPAQTMTTAAEPSLESARRIPRDEAMKLVKEKKAVFVDVRGTEAYKSGHIKGALDIPEFELVNRLKEIPAGRMIITYCA